MLLLNEILSRGGELQSSKVNSFKHTPKSVKSKGADTSSKKTESKVMTSKRKASFTTNNTKKNLSKDAYNSNNNTGFSGEGAFDINDIEVGLELVEPINYKQKTQKLANIIREVAAGDKFEMTQKIPSTSKKTTCPPTV